MTSATSSSLERALDEYEIDTVFHLAAQTIVGVANRSPLSTFETNVRGTWTLLEACRRSPLVRAIVVASTDKAYGEHDVLPYAEDAPLIGRHPYDVSKSCTDLIAQAYAADVRPAGRDHALRQHLRRRRPELEPDRPRHDPLGDPRRRAPSSAPTASRSATTSTSRTARPPTCTSRGRLREQPELAGEAFNFSNAAQVTVKRDRRADPRAARADRSRAGRSRTTRRTRSRRSTSIRRRRERVLGWKPEFDLAQGLDAHDRLVPQRSSARMSAEPDVDGRARDPPGDDPPARRRSTTTSRSAHARSSPASRRCRCPGGSSTRTSCSCSSTPGLDFWLTTGRYAAEFERDFAPLLRAPPRDPRQLGLVGEPPGAERADLAAAARPAAPAGRRGDHGRRGLPDDGQPDRPERARPGLRRRDAADLQHRRLAARGGAQRPHARDHDRAHARQPVRRRAPSRRSPTSTTSGSIEDCCDAVGSTVGGRHVGTLRRPRDDELLSRPPHHDGRGRVRCSRTGRRSSSSSSRSATGAATAGASPGVDNTCGKRFDWQLGDLPHGYDHKYTYSHIGYNLKVDRHAGRRRRGAAREAAAASSRPVAGTSRRCARASPTSSTSSCCPRRRRAPTRAGSASRSPFARTRRSTATP